LGKWVSKDGDQARSSSGAHAEDGDEEQTDFVVDGDGARFQAREEDVGPSVGIMGDRITSMTPFERLVLRRMDDLADVQRSHHEFCVARFQGIDEEIEVVQNQLFEIQYGRDD